MMRAIEMGGFSIDLSVQRGILIVFVVYSVIILIFGFWVKISGGKGSVSDFLTGGGNLHFIETSMIAATSVMAGGTMISAPGMCYRDGLGYVLITFAYVVNSFLALTCYGKRNVIIKNRIKAQSVSTLLRYRFQSRITTICITGCTVIFLVLVAGAQLMLSARIFNVILGTDSYAIGLLISTMVILLYTIVGGVKSLSRVCVAQGAFMLFAVIFVGFSTFGKIQNEYGSMQTALELTSRLKPELITNIYKPEYIFSLLLATTIGNACHPTCTIVTMTYDKVKVMKRTLIITIIFQALVQLIMSTSGALAYTLNPGITIPDNASIYLTTNLLPGWMAGIVIAGIFAAIQSSVASFLICTCGMLVQDVYKGCINKKATDKAVLWINRGGFAITIGLAFLYALKPIPAAQAIIILAGGGVAISYGIPFIFGTLWRKATAAGAMASCLGGMAVYAFFQYNCQTDWYKNVFGELQATTLGMAGAVLLMIGVSLCTQKYKIPLGCYRVWFCKDYDERYAQCFDKEDLAKIEED